MFEDSLRVSILQRVHVKSMVRNTNVNSMQRDFVSIKKPDRSFTQESKGLTKKIKWEHNKVADPKKGFKTIEERIQ